MLGWGAIGSEGAATEVTVGDRLGLLVAWDGEV
jgi:hypothetical protein